MFIVWITECLLYFCFCVLTGGLIFYSLPAEKRPDIYIPKQVILWCAAGAGILSFAPILATVINLSQSLGFWTSFNGVVFTFDIGKAWLFTAAVALLLFGLIFFNRLENDPFLSKIGVVLCVFLIAGYARSGHAASLTEYTGFIAHFLHLMAVAVWGGGLIVAAWFSQSDKNWRSFLKWFTPLAIISVIVVIVAGIVTMAVDIAKPLDYSIPSTIHQYGQGLLSSYGQALLIKHVLIIPLLIYAAFNGFYTRRMLDNPDRHFRPLFWVRVESVVLFAVFAVTAFMGQQAPPHEPEQYIAFYGPSPLFSAIYQGDVARETVLHFSMNPISMTFAGLSLLLLIVIAFGLIRRSPWIMAILLSCGFLISSYLSVMTAIEI